MCLGVPGRVVDVAEVDGIKMGRVDFGGASRVVCLEHVDVEPGDYVLVHVGFALTKLSPREADELLEMLRQLTGEGELTEAGAPEEKP